MRAFLDGSGHHEFVLGMFYSVSELSRLVAATEWVGTVAIRLRVES